MLSLVCPMAKPSPVSWAASYTAAHYPQPPGQPQPLQTPAPTRAPRAHSISPSQRGETMGPLGAGVGGGGRAHPPCTYHSQKPLRARIVVLSSHGGDPASRSPRCSLLTAWCRVRGTHGEPTTARRCSTEAVWGFSLFYPQASSCRSPPGCCGVKHKGLHQGFASVEPATGTSMS